MHCTFCTFSLSNWELSKSNLISFLSRLCHLIHYRDGKWKKGLMTHAGQYPSLSNVMLLSRSKLQVPMKLKGRPHSDRHRGIWDQERHLRIQLGFPCGQLQLQIIFSLYPLKHSTSHFSPLNILTGIYRTLLCRTQSCSIV